MVVAGWAFFALVLAGLYLHGLRPDGHWTPEGWVRLWVFLGAGALITALAAVLKARRIVVLFLAAWVVYGVAAGGPAGVAAVVWTLAACWAAGRLLFARIEDALIATALGLAGWIVLFHILVRFPINFSWVWWMLTAVPIVWAAARGLRPPALGEAETAGQRAWTTALMVILTAHFLLAFKPEVSADGLSWHLLAPARIAAYASWPFDVSEFAWAAMPMGGDWVWSLTWLFGEEKGARLMNFALLALTTGLVSRRAGTAAAALWASTPLVMLATGSLFVENVWAYLLLAAFLLAWDDEPRAWAVALLAGAASACKLMAVPMAAPIVAWALWKSKQWRPAVLFLATGTMPYVEEIVRTGNPFFPYFNGIFKSPYYPSEKNLEDVRFTQTLNWRSMWDMTFRTTLYCESPGGGFGFQWLALMPATVYAFIRRRDAMMRAALALGAAEIVIVFFGQPYIRYMYAALLLWTLAIGKASESGQWKWLMAAVCGLNLMYFANAGWYHRDFIIEPITEQGRMARYEAESAPLKPLIEYANRELPGEAIGFVTLEGAGRLHARAWVNTWHGGFFAEELRRARTAEEARRLLETGGIQYWIGPAGEQPELFSNIASWELSSPEESRIEFQSGNWALYRLLPSESGRGRRYCPQGEFDDLSRCLHLRGAWTRDRQFSDAFRHSLLYCDKATCEAEFDFEGGAVTLIHTKAFNRGQAEILIDGKAAGTLDGYAGEIRWQQRVRFEAGARGRHTLTVRVLGRRAAGAQGSFVDIDGFVVE
jgi:hypothetical protein